jgi:hypothetical protein
MDKTVDEDVNKARKKNAATSSVSSQDKEKEKEKEREKDANVRERSSRERDRDKDRDRSQNQALKGKEESSPKNRLAGTNGGSQGPKERGSSAPSAGSLPRRKTDEKSLSRTSARPPSSTSSKQTKPKPTKDEPVASRVEPPKNDYLVDVLTFSMDD